MKDGVILVGGFPPPVGGVTTFVRRLAASDGRVEEVVDLYADGDKEIPAGYAGRYRALQGRWRGFVYLALRMRLWRGKRVHFNFSNLKSLVFLVLLPKNGTRWVLMLHHGVLESRVPGFLVRHVLGRCDHIVCLNDAQYQTYRRHGVPPGRLVRASSYITPPAGRPDPTFQRDIDAFCSSRPTFVASGYPRPLYHHDWCIRFVADRREYQLALFLYGEGSEKARLQEAAGRCDNIRVYWDRPEDDFNFALSRSFCYLRPNVRDSFGIAVADAVNYGVPVLASDVCPRWPGASTFRVTTYQSFADALVALVSGGSTGLHAAATPVVPFSYDLIA